MNEDGIIGILTGLALGCIISTGIIRKHPPTPQIHPDSIAWIGSDCQLTYEGEKYFRRGRGFWYC